LPHLLPMPGGTGRDGAVRARDADRDTEGGGPLKAPQRLSCTLTARPHLRIGVRQHSSAPRPPAFLRPAAAGGLARAAGDPSWNDRRRWLFAVIARAAELGRRREQNADGESAPRRPAFWRPAVAGSRSVIDVRPRPSHAPPNASGDESRTPTASAPRLGVVAAGAGRLGGGGQRGWVPRAQLITSGYTPHSRASTTFTIRTRNANAQPDWKIGLLFSGSNHRQYSSTQRDKPARPTSLHTSDRRNFPSRRPNPCCGRWQR
jgi:hypothetical protein